VIEQRPDGDASRGIARYTTRKSSWVSALATHRRDLRKAARLHCLAGKVVEADETYFGNLSEKLLRLQGTCEGEQRPAIGVVPWVL
jgi:hypothetical protein